jgi:hypothetical protein
MHELRSEPGLSSDGATAASLGGRRAVRCSVQWLKHPCRYPAGKQGQCSAPGLEKDL